MAKKKKLTFREAIVKVLSNGEPKHYTEIADEIIRLDLVKKYGATPAATVNVTINEDIRKFGNESHFESVGKYSGRYRLKPSVVPIKGNEEENDVSKIPSKSKSLDRTTDAPTTIEKTNTVSLDESTISEEHGIIGAFGMYWRRDKVNWKTTSVKLFGQTYKGKSEKVNFSGQVGIYLLYDGHSLIYVGQTKKRVDDNSLGARLKEHNSDKFAGRWDRFSWFGLRSVKENGQLMDLHSNAEIEFVISLLEGVLIECMEPPLNRRRGDRLDEIEFVQIEDEEIERKHTEKVLKQWLERVKNT